MANLIEFTVVYDSEHDAISERRPVRMLVDSASIETVMEDPIEPDSDMWPKGCRISLCPAIAEYGESDEVVQGQRMLVVGEPYGQIKEALSKERGIVLMPVDLS